MNVVAGMPPLASATEEFLRRRHELLIGGRWVPAASARRFDVHDRGAWLGCLHQLVVGGLGREVEEVAQPGRPGDLATAGRHPFPLEPRPQVVDGLGPLRCRQLGERREDLHR